MSVLFGLPRTYGDYETCAILYNYEQRGEARRRRPYMFLGDYYEPSVWEITLHFGEDRTITFTRQDDLRCSRPYIKTIFESLP